MREQSLPLTQAPDLLELRLAETFNTKVHSDFLKLIERLPYPFYIVNLKAAAKEKQKPIPGKVFFLTREEYDLLYKKIPKWKESWFVLIEDDVKGKEYIDAPNFFVLDQETKDQIPSLLELINEKFCHEKKKHLCQHAIKNAQVLGKEAVRFLEDLQESYTGRGEGLGSMGKNALQVMEELLNNYGKFFVIEDMPDLEMLIKKTVTKSKIVKTVQIFEDFDSLIEEDKGGGMILPLVNGDTIALALYRFPKNISAIAPFYTYFFNSLLSIAFSKLNPGVEEDENALWKEAFSKFPFPCALVSQSGELALHNPAFSKLNLSPAALSKLKHQEKVEVENKVFELNRIDVSVNEEAQSLLMLMSDNIKPDAPAMSTDSSSSEELGIISSSIAHELNNPLAGILATIAVLELEDEWMEDPEVSQGLFEMKQSGKRCKDLIEIFLGFSKAMPTKGDADQVDAIFHKALELIRFRTIESNVRFEFSMQKSSGPFKREINSSIVSMMFYLILNETLTSFSHHKLISNDDDTVLRGTFYESPNKVVVEMEKDFDFQKSISESKLIQHLLDLVGMSLQVEQRRIILSEWTLT